MDNALEEVQQPGLVLMIAGAVIMIFYGLYAVSGIVGLLFTCFGGGVAALGVAAGEGSLISLGLVGWGGAMGLLGLVLYVVLAGMGFVVFQASAALKELRDLDKVKRGMMLAAAVPIIGLIANIAISILSMNFCGVITYTVPQVVVLLVGGAAAYLTNQVLQNEDVITQFTD